MGTLQVVQRGAQPRTLDTVQISHMIHVLNRDDRHSPWWRLCSEVAAPSCPILSMLRVAFSRAVAVSRSTGWARSSALPRTSLLRLARYESQDARKQWLDKKDDLQRDWDAKELTYEELKPKTEQPSTDKYLIDVREPDEVRLGAIPSAVNLPLSVLSGALHLSPDAFKAQYGFDKPKKDQEVVFYCRSGKRSTTACDVAKRNGFTNLLNYKGSWLEWSEREGIKPAS